jgi:hypothetical protein
MLTGWNFPILLFLLSRKKTITKNFKFMQWNFTWNFKWNRFLSVTTKYSIIIWFVRVCRLSSFRLAHVPYNRKQARSQFYIFSRTAQTLMLSISYFIFILRKTISLKAFQQVRQRLYIFVEISSEQKKEWRLVSKWSIITINMGKSSKFKPVKILKLFRPGRFRVLTNFHVSCRCFWLNSRMRCWNHDNEQYVD